MPGTRALSYPSFYMTVRTWGDDTTTAEIWNETPLPSLHSKLKTFDCHPSDEKKEKKEILNVYMAGYMRIFSQSR